MAAGMYTLKTRGPSRTSSLLSTSLVGLGSKCFPQHPTYTLTKPTSPLKCSTNSLLAEFQHLRMMLDFVSFRVVPWPIVWMRMRSHGHSSVDAVGELCWHDTVLWCSPSWASWTTTNRLLAIQRRKWRESLGYRVDAYLMTRTHLVGRQWLCLILCHLHPVIGL